MAGPQVGRFAVVRGLVCVASASAAASVGGVEYNGIKTCREQLFESYVNITRSLIGSPLESEGMCLESQCASLQMDEVDIYFRAESATMKSPVVYMTSQTPGLRKALADPGT
jgi:hypothetical protein